MAAATTTPASSKIRMLVQAESRDVHGEKVIYPKGRVFTPTEAERKELAGLFEPVATASDDSTDAVATGAAGAD
ncbi:hypothetical protein C4K68_07765 [Pokkaliibacter plantistimulans]|uniref:Uncharacterized protein n=1 Tax=Proteobacteria bacterium 228 TaxID=2083153 RepID=A0A2S5KSW7_9PROT|nr:hypothetical protein [Pokkaliibacter plantistimulans]PPC77934.1 hypothetical protein C4K68_07765 [Pokkaliibacter plantistimulans]